MARTKEFNTEDVLHKAVNLFRTKGYNGSSMQEIVACTGLSRSSIYDTYGDKHQLFLLALKKYKEETTGGLVKMFSESTDIKATLREMFTYIMNMSLSTGPETSCFVTNATIEMAAFDPEIATLARDNMEELESAVANAIRRHQEQGKVSTQHNPEALSQFFFTNISGLRVVARSGADRVALEAIVEVVLSVL